MGGRSVSLSERDEWQDPYILPVILRTIFESLQSGFGGDAVTLNDSLGVNLLVDESLCLPQEFTSKDAAAGKVSLN